MNRFLRTLLPFSALAVGLALEGCASTATPPTPMTPDQLNAALQNTTPENQIDWINRSPMPPDQKEAKIKAIREKYHLPEPSGGGQ